MKSAVIVFPGSNCDRDLAVALEGASGNKPAMVWHKDAELPAGLDLIAIPGGFSFGDHLRCGAIAARAPIMRSVVKFANAGGMVIGICNGFQVLIETGLLPGALMRNAGIKFVCKDVDLKVETTNSAFTNAFQPGQIVRFPVAHHDGNYFASSDVITELNDNERIAFRYTDNPNGSIENIAGILSENKRILGMMPHPERAADAQLGNTQGLPLFRSLVSALETAV